MAAHSLTPEIRLAVIRAEERAYGAVAIHGQECAARFIEARNHAVVAPKFEHVCASWFVAQCLRRTQIGRHIETREFGAMLFEMLNQMLSGREAGRITTRSGSR